MSETFLPLRVKLPRGMGKDLEKLEDGFIPYDGSAAKHKIPHVTVVPPREGLAMGDWKEKIREVRSIPTKIRITGFGPLWDPSKPGVWGDLDADIGGARRNDIPKKEALFA